MDLKKINKIFFVGIGGIGISAAARILKKQGKVVLGSDAGQSEIIQQLLADGIVVSSHKKENINPDIDLLVYSVAVAEDNPERQEANHLNIPQLTYPQLLGQMIADFDAIGVSGTNGKTTSTAILGKIFLEAQLDPTIVVGAKVDYLNQSNERIGGSKYFIFEADEYRKAFLNYPSKMAVLTYIDADHLDCYKDLADIISTFNKYLISLGENGFIIANKDDKNTTLALNGCKGKIISYGCDNNADYQAKNIQIKNNQQFFEVWEKGQLACQVKINLPGKYNVYNALAAITAARVNGIEWQFILKALENFHGTWRRFQLLGEKEKIKYIIDYAHTPDAVAKTIEAARDFYPGQKILAVFQPHQYNRTKNFFKEFSQSFDQADKAIISDIFYVAGRENPNDFSINSEKLTEAIERNGADVAYGGNLIQTEKKIKELAKDYQVVLMMGAGDIYEMAKKII